MKKILLCVLAFVLCFSAMLSLVACYPTENTKKDDETTTNDNSDNKVPEVDPNAVYWGDYFDFDISSFIEIPKLSDITVPKSIVERVLEVNTVLALSSVESFSKLEKDTPAQKYDTVIIDFEGKPKDESIKLSEDVLKGMTAKDYEIMIGSGSFIGAYDHPSDDSLDTAGFEDQMIGIKVGETKDILVTFPDNYGEKALAGMQTVFTVTISSANRPKPIDDEIAQKNGYENAKAFDEEVLKLSKSQAALEHVLEQVNIKEYPVGEMEVLVDYFIQSYVEYYYGYGATEEQVNEIKKTYGESAKEWSQEYAKERMSFKRIAEMQGISITEKELADYAQKEAENFGIGSGDTLIAYYGKDTIWFDCLYKTVIEEIEKNVSFEN